MITLQEAITSHAFFHGMKPEHLALLAEGAKSTQFQAGEILFEQGQPANQFYLIQTGKVALEALEPHKSATLVEVLSAGEVLGWSWMFPPFSWHFQARALEPVQAIVLSGGHLLVTAERNSEFGYDLLKRVAQVVIHRLQATRKRCLARETTSALKEVAAGLNSVVSSPPGSGSMLIQNLIAQHPFFKNLNPRFVEVLSQCASIERFGPGQDIFREGQLAERFYLINKGRVALETFVPRSGATIVQTVEAGRALGWSWLYPPYEWQFSARAMDPVETVVFSAATLRTRAEEDHDFGYEIMSRVGRVILETLQGTRRKLVEFYVRDLVE